jgi:hypothetical protein
VELPPIALRDERAQPVTDDIFSHDLKLAAA